ncbi:MAG: 2,3-bisphosphoglycerate-independent phosphoglycerate mutase [Patescibacteria group bacterium]
MENNVPKPLVLIILDGWGIAAPSTGNAITLAKTPNFNRFVANYPAMTLLAAGEAVGLPENEPGNSEVGHMTLGCGKIFYQNLPRINRAIKDGDFFNNQILLKAINHVKVYKSKLHLIGMLSDGNVQGSIVHIMAALDLAKRNNVSRVYIHGILDGVDSVKNSGSDFIRQLQKYLLDNGIGDIASISGRFYALDRDGHWERTQKAFNAMANGQSEEFYDDPVEAVEASYRKDIFDEGFLPTVITSGGEPKTTIDANDAVIFLNLKGDRARQLTLALAAKDFDKFERSTKIDNLVFVTLTHYQPDLPVDVAFPKQFIKTSLAKVISNNGLKQLDLAETEKFAHVTFFFGGAAQQPFINEDRVMIPSPHVESYADTPSMSAFEISKRMEKEILREVYDFVVCNFANADMVGHTGNTAAAVAAVEAVDKCLGTIADLVLSKDGAVILVGDHGNAEEMHNLKTGEDEKFHTKNPVPLVLIGKKWEGKNIPGSESIGNDLSLVKPAGMLSDVAPTILKILKLPIPAEMSGKSLI